MQAVRNSSVVNRSVHPGSETGRETRSRVYKKVKSAGMSGLKSVQSDVTQVKDTKKHIIRIIFLFALLLLVGIAFNAYQSAINYDITEMNGKISDVRNEIDNLNLQVASAIAPNVIEDRAINELGMEYPSASQYVYIDAVNKDSK